jgi:Chalcone isomerase-like
VSELASLHPRLDNHKGSRTAKVGAAGKADNLRKVVYRAVLEGLFWAALLVLAASTTRAAELAGVTMPDRQDIGGYHLVLNGMGLRTYSILRVKIYVAGLYLEHRLTDGNAILNSSRPKLLHFVFLHDVGAADARKSWREGFDRNCLAPCRLPGDKIDQFLAAIPSVHEGDTSSLLFTGRKVDFLLNGHLLGRVTDPDFTRVILATFVGPYPTSEEVKSGLLGNLGDE